jgi:thiamine biosynthesis protein ThiS
LEVHLQLYSVLREKLPPETKGRTVLHLEEGATLADILSRLDIKRRVVVSVNGVHESDYSRPIRDGDEMKIFSAVGGGASALPFNHRKLDYHHK